MYPRSPGSAKGCDAGRACGSHTVFRGAKRRTGADHVRRRHVRGCRCRAPCQSRPTTAAAPAHGPCRQRSPPVVARGCPGIASGELHSGLRRSRIYAIRRCGLSWDGSRRVASGAIHPTSAGPPDLLPPPVPLLPVGEPVCARTALPVREGRCDARTDPGHAAHERARRIRSVRSCGSTGRRHIGRKGWDFADEVHDRFLHPRYGRVRHGAAPGARGRPAL